MNDKAKRAKELFLEGYGCAQSVLLAFREELNIDKDTAVLIASSFGGGMGRLREVCGCVSGMFMVAGLKKGPLNPKDFKAKEGHYRLIQSLAEDFKKETGSIICRELLGLPANSKSAPAPQPRTQEYYKKRPCPDMVALAADILEKRLFS
ncbi:C-GCAxxG-C-C family protein [Candidatus Proelusimicrobium excrementi]|uniref:C-GCAxxG-C-C family protein n=1 Tax=Candidatus Proelusimicrobium excrementi TaxID=3416222 RepID=UPI003D13360C